MTQAITKMEQWRKVPELVQWAMKVFGSAEWKLLNQVMQEGEHVRLYDSHGVDPIQKLGRIEGWDLYNSTLKHASSPTVGEQFVESTFDPPETEQSPVVSKSKKGK